MPIRRTVRRATLSVVPGVERAKLRELGEIRAAMVDLRSDVAKAQEAQERAERRERIMVALTVLSILVALLFGFGLPE